MKLVHTYIFLVIVLFSVACNKYKSFNGEGTITGYAYLADSITDGLPVPLTNQTVYLNTGGDTSSYFYQVKTDQAGFFSISSLSGEKDYILFTRLLKNDIEYKGAVKVPGSDVSKTGKVTLNVYPSYINGMSVLFTDTLGGIFPGLPFRIYNSRLAATADSVKYAFADTLTSTKGLFSIFNIKPAKYYFVAKESIGGLPLKIFDSVTVASTGIKKGNVYLKQ
jgi:hypothetical protein